MGKLIISPATDPLLSSVAYQRRSRRMCMPRVMSKWAQRRRHRTRRRILHPRMRRLETIIHVVTSGTSFASPRPPSAPSRHAKGNTHGSQNLHRIHQANPCLVATLIRSETNVWSDAVGVWEEERERDHLDADYQVRDADVGVCLGEAGCWVQGRC
jgi:hypothetical protein